MTEVESAIQFIDAHDRTTWISVGFGLKSEYGESAWELFDRWSSTASNYNAEVARSQWKSFKQGDKIFDSHGGSMSSVIAALNLGFEITCLELDSDYYAAGVARVRQSQQQVRMFADEPDRKPEQRIML